MDVHNKKSPLVSIIVPAYNVEMYIEMCVRSVIKQTYKNIEIIVVNDGSTDDTPQILNRIKESDNRICVVHKKNEGVSTARNTGLDVALGEYIVFVDGDDYISDDYVEYMLQAMLKTDSEIFISKNCYTKRDESQVKEDRIDILSSEDATALLLSPRIIVGCWNKMFKMSFLNRNKLCFSTTLFYGEGLYFITTASQLAKNIVVGNRKVYYYRRNNELSATTKFDIEKIYNGEKALNIISRDIKINTKKIDAMLLLHKSLFYLGALTRIQANGLKSQLKDDYKKWLLFLRHNYFFIIKSKDVSMYRKLMLLGGCISPWIMMKLDLIRRKKIVAESVD